MAPPKKNKRNSQRSRKRAQEQQPGGDNGPNENGSYWAQFAVKVPLTVGKTFDSEFPALPGTASDVVTNNDTWVSPADMRDPNEWDTSGAIADGWNFGTPDDLLACSLYNKTPAQYWEEVAANPVDPNVWVDPTPAKSDEQLLKERIENNLKGWPWNDSSPPESLTLAPYHLNGYGTTSRSVLSKKQDDQKSDFFTKLMNIEDLALLVLKFVFKHHSSAWKLAATCQKLWHLVSRNVDIWDMTGGHFNHCDQIIEKNAKRTAENAAGNSVSKYDSLKDGAVSAHLIVSPLRRSTGSASYVEQVRNLRSMCVSVNNFKHSLRNIHFHRVPFLNINILALLIPQMTKLEDLGIFNCRLMTLASGLRLLDLLKVDRMKGKEHSVYLDFYPNYHLGPEEGGRYNTGKYGVSWDNLNFDTCVGIWCLTKRIVAQARKQNIDLESPHTMFRQWLENTPCWAVGDTLESFFDPKMKPLEVAAMVQYRFTHGKPSKLTSIHGYTDDPKWWGRDIYCIECEQTQMGVFSPKNQVYRNQAGRWQCPQCYGCQLTWELRREKDHYKAEKRCIIRDWLLDRDATTGTATWNTLDLSRAIEDYELRGIEQMAFNLDEQRKREKEYLGYDKETQERQVPKSREELGRKSGNWRRSPDVDASKAKAKAYFHYRDTGDDSEWKWYDDRPDKYDGHGRVY